MKSMFAWLRKGKINNNKSDIKSKLQDSEARFKILFDYSVMGIAQLDMDGQIIKANQALCDLLGYQDQNNLLAKNFYHILNSNDSDNLKIHASYLIDKQMPVYQNEQQCHRKSGELVWVVTTLSYVKNGSHASSYFVVQLQDITQQKNAEERLQHMAYHDSLTGVANRNKLEQFVSHILAAARRHQQGFALLFLDLDRFKNINDTIGHEAGDILLQIVAERLKSTIRNTDLIARLGGDEFVLVVTDVKRTEAVALIAQKILESVMQAITVNGQEIYITTSIGISLYPYDGQNMQMLMKNADLALYRAKEQGRNNYQFYTSEMTSKTQEKMALQNALGHALAKDEFKLNYQPKMDVKTKKITGIEAFLRWKNQEYNMITPDEIVGLAEETGLILPVSEWVFATACNQLKSWHDMGMTTLTMAVNCSSRQFKQTTFVDEVLRTINRVNLQPHSLEIEITERIIMDDPENTLRILYALKDLGIQIVIDDFGTGYWSLNNLRRLSVDKIKIDQTFIKQIALDDISSSIVSGTIALANKLNIKSIAEGVETEEQYNFLAREGCTEIQGYYITHPLTAESMTTFLLHPIPDAEREKEMEETT